MTYLPEIDASRRRVPFISEDPRFLIALFLITVVSAFIAPRSAGLLVVIGYETILLVCLGMKVRALLLHIRRLAVFVVLILLINAIVVDGRPLPAPFSFLSLDGLGAGVYYSLRVLALWFALAFLLRAVPPEAMAAGLAAFVGGISSTGAKRLALHGFLTMSFLPLFGDEVTRIRNAQSFRGGGFTGGVWQRLRAARLLVVPLIVSAVNRSHQLAMAVEVRSIGDRIDRMLTLEAPAARDFVFAGATLIVLFVAVMV